MYPTRFQLAGLTRHLLALLEHRRAGMGEWNPDVEAHLRAEAKAALEEAGQQFRELADDAPYWERTTRVLLTVMVPHYLKVAREEHLLEVKKYGVWRGGDLIARAAYAAVGLALALVVWRSAIPDWIEPLPLGFLVGGPLLPDLQVWWAKRRYRNRLGTLVQEMETERAQLATYQSLGVLPVDERPTASAQPPSEKERV